MQMDRVNGRTVAEHGGDIGGFAALFAVLPGEDSGFFIVNHGEGSNLRFEVKDALLDRLYPAREKPAVPRATPRERTGTAGIRRSLPFEPRLSQLSRRG